MDYSPLNREQVASVVEGRSIASRVPIDLHLWVHPAEFGDRRGEVEEILRRYPADTQIIPLRIPKVYDAPPDDPEYRWVNYERPGSEKTGAPIDARIAIDTWDRLDGVLSDFPDPRYAGLFENDAAADGRFRLAHWWFCLFERHWSLRGMTNALMDYYTDPESVHRLFRALTDLYIGWIERSHREISADAIFTSDDLGTQTAPFFSPDIFREFFKPYYRELIARAHALGMQFWLHACGNIEEFLDDFVEIGLDVIHPIQKHAMDEKKIAAGYGADICIWGGFDVQRIIPWGTPDEVRREVRFMMDTYHRPEGRFMFTAGNGINGDCTLESLEALFDEAFGYGTEIVARDA